MGKKILRLLFSTVVIASFLAILPFEASADETSGTCGNNLDWTIDDNGTLIIEGNGKMVDYNDPSDVPWYSSRTSIKTIVINNGVTSIGKNAFFTVTNQQA